MVFTGTRRRVRSHLYISCILCTLDLNGVQYLCELVCIKRLQKIISCLHVVTGNRKSIAAGNKNKSTGVAFFPKLGGQVHTIGLLYVDIKKNQVITAGRIAVPEIFR